MAKRRFWKKETKVLSFPTSARERRRILRSGEDARGRYCTTARLIVGWMLAIAIFMFLLMNYRLFSLTSIRSVAEYVSAGLQQRKGELAAINYQNDAFSEAVLFRGSLAYVDSDTLYLARPGNITIRDHQLSYSSVALQANDNYMFTYESGGYNATLFNTYSAVCELTTESPILSGYLSESDKSVLITDEKGYRSAVAVYNADGEELFKWSASEYYILSAALSPDEKTLATLTYKQEGLALNSYVMLYSVSSGELVSETMLEDTFGITLSYLSGSTVAVICDDGVYTISRKGDAKQVFSFTADELQYFLAEDNMIAIVTRAHSGSARSELSLIYSDGSVSQSLLLSEEPSAVAISGTKIGILTAKGVSVYELDLTPLWRNSEAVGARRILLMDDGTVYALYAQNARVFNAQNEQSEAFTNDNS